MDSFVSLTFRFPPEIILDDRTPYACNDQIIQGLNPFTTTCESKDNVLTLTNCFVNQIPSSYGIEFRVTGLKNYRSVQPSGKLQF